LQVVTNGEPKGLRKQFQADTKLATLARRALITAVFAGAIAAAIVVPLDNARDKPRVGPDGITLTAAEANGRALFAKTCSTCHTLAAVQAVARIGPDLDVLRPSESVVLYAINNGFAAGLGQMPAGLYSGQDATDIAQFVAAVAGR
jgi:mono/diheme cytochrome c family protein